METRSTLDAGRDVRLRARAFAFIERRSPRARVVTRRRASPCARARDARETRDVRSRSRASTARVARASRARLARARARRGFFHRRRPSRARRTHRRVARRAGRCVRARAMVFHRRRAGADALDRDEDRARSEAAYLEWDPADERAAFERASETNGTVRVRAFGPWRSLRFNDVEQGLAYVVEGEGEEARADASALPFEYLRVMTAAATGGVAHRGVDLCAREAVHGVKFLYVGLGAGAAPAFAKLKYPACEVEAVELDPVVVEAARECLRVEFTTSERSVRARGRQEMMNVIVGDCAEAMRDVERGSVDVIFLDAFDGDGEIPEHVSGEAFLQSCHDALKDDGSVVLNMFNGVRGSRARASVREFARRLETRVGPVCSFPVIESPVNVVLSATKRGQSRLTREEFVAATKYVESRADFAWSMHKLVEGAFWVDASGDE